MKTLLHAVVVMTFLLVGETASAQNLNLKIFGSSDCGQWLNQPTSSRKACLVGFLSGQNATFNMVKDDRVKDPLERLNSAEQAFVWMDNYCRANPLKRVDEGAQVLFVELLNQK